MSFGGFTTAGVKRIRAVSQTIEGEGASSVVVACDLEIEHNDGELSYKFDDGQGPVLAAFQVWLNVLNRSLDQN